MKRYKPLLLMLSLMVCGWIWLWMGVFVNLSPQRAIERLEAARTRWAEQGVDDYRMSISFGSTNFVGWFEITVRDGVVVELTPQNDGSYEQRLGDIFLDSLDVYTVDNLFTFMQHELADVPALPLISMCSSEINEMRYEVQYDETGYIREIMYSNCPQVNLGGGLMCPVVSHCSSLFSVNTLEALIDESP